MYVVCIVKLYVHTIATYIIIINSDTASMYNFRIFYYAFQSQDRVLRQHS